MVKLVVDVDSHRLAKVCHDHDYESADAAINDALQLYTELENSAELVDGPGAEGDDA